MMNWKKTFGEKMQKNITNILVKYLKLHFMHYVITIVKSRE